MIQKRLDGNALPGAQPYLRACRYRIFPSVAVYQDIRICQTFFFIGIVYAYEYIAAAPVDDILHLVPVKVHGGRLSFLHVQQLFRIWFCILIHGHIAVSQRDKGEPHFVKIPHSKIRDIPSQHVIPDFIILMSFFLPFFWRKTAEWGKFKGTSANHLLHVLKGPVNFRTFHVFPPFPSQSRWENTLIV